MGIMKGLRRKLVFKLRFKGVEFNWVESEVKIFQKEKRQGGGA